MFVLILTFQSFKYNFPKHAKYYVDNVDVLVTEQSRFIEFVYNHINNDYMYNLI